MFVRKSNLRTSSRHFEIRDGKIGNAISQFMTGMDVINAAKEILAAEPDALLCDDPDCHRCTQGRLRIAKACNA